MKLMAREGFAPDSNQRVDSVSEMNRGSLRCSHGERREVLAFLLSHWVSLESFNRTSFRLPRAFAHGPLRMGLVLVIGVWKQYEQVQKSRTFFQRPWQLPQPLKSLL